MDLVDYLKVLRRRWVVVAACGLAALVVALVTLPPAPSTSSAPQAPTISGYKATTTLLQTSTGNATVPASTLPIFVARGAVPKAAAKKLGYDGDPNVLGQTVNVSIDDKVGTIGIVATDPDAQRAVETSSAFSTALIDYLRSRAQGDIDRKIKLLEGVIERYTARSETITGTGSLADAQRQAIQQAISGVQGEIIRLQVSSATAGFDLEILQPATPEAVLTKPGGAISTGPSNRWLRLAVLIGTGLLLGAGLALGIERFDTRLRGRQAVEDALRLPVVASVPPLPHGKRGRREVAAAAHPQGAIAESYRSLRSALFLLPSRPPGGDDTTVRDPRVVLMVSPRASDGKTTSLVNLASALAEAGRSVVVLDCDFRHPEAHQFLGVPEGRGLSDLLATDRTVPLVSILQPTILPGVRLALAGTSTQHPGALMGLMQPYVDQARDLADVVLIDAPPALLANDAVDLMPVVDSVVVVVRDGRTSTTEAQRLTGLLDRLRQPCLGIVLVASHDAGAAYFGRGETIRRRLGRSHDGPAHRPGARRRGRGPA